MHCWCVTVWMLNAADDWQQLQWHAKDHVSNQGDLVLILKLLESDKNIIMTGFHVGK